MIIMNISDCGLITLVKQVYCECEDKGYHFFLQGFNPAEVPTAYGDTLTFWDWKQRKVMQTVKLGPDGLIPLELRFLHDPSQPHGFVGAALSSNVIHFTKVGPPYTTQLHPIVSAHRPCLLCNICLLSGPCSGD